MKDSDKITVAHVAAGLDRGGVEMVVYRYLSHMDPDSYRWIYITYKPSEEGMRRMFEEKGIHVFQVTRRKDNLLKSCFEVWKILKENQVQILHSHLTQTCFLSNLVGIAAGVKVRITHAHMVLYPKGLEKPLLLVFRKLSIWTATAKFACSKEAANDFYGKKGAKTAVIMNNALDLNRFHFDADVRTQMRKTWGLEGVTLLGHVGRFSKAKNQEFLLNVFAEYHRQEKDSRLVLVGGGPLLDEVKAKAAELKVEDCVLFIPPTEEVNRWYMAMDVFVFPSQFEGFGLTALEAQLAGLPVVASSRVPKEVAFSDKVRFVSLEEGIQVWTDQIRAAAADGRGEDIRDKLTAANLDIGTEAKKLDHFYRYGVWK